MGLPQLYASSMMVIELRTTNMYMIKLVIVCDDADQDVNIGFSQSIYSVREDSGEIQVSVRIISGEIKRLSTVSISIVSGTALGMFVCAKIVLVRVHLAACSSIYGMYSGITYYASYKLLGSPALC